VEDILRVIDRKRGNFKKMYKVVLIDDAEIILEGLKKSLDWEKYDCEVVATAGNAAEGNLAIRLWRPDILITDIKMPGEDGLTMLAGLRSEFPVMQVAVLSGYRDFEYAQRAIRLGVSRFLLKPSSLEDMQEALSCMTSALSENGSAREAEDMAQRVEGGATSFVVDQALQYMEEHFSEKVMLQDVATHCYVSQWHLSKMLHKYLEKNFYEIINDFRIEKAKELLNDPRLTVSGVCELVGYSDPAHFSKVFKKIVGVNPKVYRETLRSSFRNRRI
jgi:two-component system response regulator YesN